MSNGSSTGAGGLGGNFLGMIGGQILGGLGQAIFGGAARRKAARREKALQKQLYRLEQNRQAIVNPFADVTDLSSQLSNPFANLQVATEAAEMQAQQTDISLASSLDTLRATGAGAGGATALAQAALSSKQGVSASIAQQEARNAQLRAQGQQQLEMNRMKEQQRIQMAMAQGKQFVFGAQESREMQKLNRVSAQLSNASQQSAAYGSQMMGGIGQALGGIGSFAATGGFGQLFGGNNQSIIPNSSIQQGLGLQQINTSTLRSGGGFGVGGYTGGGSGSSGIGVTYTPS